MAQSVYFVMDPIESINPRKDTTLAMIYEAYQRGLKVYVTEPQLLWVDRKRVDPGQKSDVAVYANCKEVIFKSNIEEFSCELEQEHSLGDARYIFMRQDPPVTIDYINGTFILEMLEELGVRVVNNPGQVRSANEKLTALRFPQCCPETIVSSQKSVFHQFLESHGDIVIKPLDGMGGQGVFRVKAGDQNLDSIVEVLSKNGREHIMAQVYIPEIVDGDKRILLINGEFVPYALARMPKDGALRGNLAAGGTGVGRELTERDRYICNEVGPWLKAHQIYFAGIDVIGPYLTEVNVTSPTCVRELDRIYNLNISGQLFDMLDAL